MLLQPHLPPRPPLRTTEVTYAELTLPRMHHHGGHAGRSHPHPAAHAHLKPASDYSPPASTSTFKAITSPPPRGSHPLVGEGLLVGVWKHIQSLNDRLVRGCESFHQSLQKWQMGIGRRGRSLPSRQQYSGTFQKRAVQLGMYRAAYKNVAM